MLSNLEQTSRRDFLKALSFPIILAVINELRPKNTPLEKFEETFKSLAGQISEKTGIPTNEIIPYVKEIWKAGEGSEKILISPKGIEYVIARRDNKITIDRRKNKNLGKA